MLATETLVVGAGLAGATAARALADAGLRARVLDKGRGPGGRLSTRRVASGGFDHGAAVLQAVGAEFGGWLDAEAAAGRAARWGDGWVGVPGMNALVAGLLDGLDARWSVPVAALAWRGHHWAALDGEGRVLTEAPRLVLAIPAPQAAALLRAGCTRMAEGDPPPPALAALLDGLAGVRYLPCWAGLATVEAAAGPVPSTDVDAEGVLQALFREAAKPGRTDAGHWVVHAGTAWSEAHLELEAGAAAERLRAAFLRATGLDAAALRGFDAHRWRYARPAHGLDAALALAVDGLALAGDAVGWRTADGLPPAERAWGSGREAAAHLLVALPPQPKS